MEVNHLVKVRSKEKNDRPIGCFLTTVITCSALPAIKNGMIAYSRDTTERYDYGTTATYQCDSGYELTEGDTVRTCTGDDSSPVGQWNGTASKCAGIIQ